MLRLADARDLVTTAYADGGRAGALDVESSTKEVFFNWPIRNRGSSRPI